MVHLLANTDDLEFIAAYLKNTFSSYETSRRFRFHRFNSMDQIGTCQGRQLLCELLQLGIFVSASIGSLAFESVPLKPLGIWHIHSSLLTEVIDLSIHSHREFARFQGGHIWRVGESTGLLLKAGYVWFFRISHAQRSMTHYFVLHQHYP